VQRYDWPAIARYYAAGHTMREAQNRFGFSNGAWARAVERGDIEPRPGRPPGRNGDTQGRVVRLLGAGLTKAAVARELGITKSSVSRHAAKAGFRIDERCARRYDWSTVQRFYDEGHSISECVAEFGFSRATFNEARRRGDVTTRPRSAPAEAVFVQGARRDRGHLKHRLRQEGLLSDACEDCGLKAWRGQPLTLQLHHRNGDGSDNRIENLILLCANCHSQTENWGGRNARRKAA
jgi:hypothetical protein